MFTKNGKKIDNLTFVDTIGYFGEVEGKRLMWDTKGRRSKVNKSPLDICTAQTFYVNVRTWAGKIVLDSRLYPTKVTAEKNARNGHLRTIQIEL